MSSKEERSDSAMQQCPSPAEAPPNLSTAFFTSAARAVDESHHTNHQHPTSTPSPSSEDRQSQSHRSGSITNADDLQIVAQLRANVSATMQVDDNMASQQAAETQAQRPQRELNSNASASQPEQQQPQQTHEQIPQQIPSAHPTIPVQHTQRSPIQPAAHMSVQPVVSVPQPRPSPAAPTQPQPSQYAQDHHPTVLTPQIPLDSHHLAAQYMVAAGSMDNTPPRKRSKVSRACDECRRKKVKCDALSETGDEPCSNCRRSGMQCMFSRVPQKRGPSRGYIKELADRIHHIEGKLGGGAVRDLIGMGSAEVAVFAGAQPAAMETNDRKRPYASISGDSIPQLETWSAEARPAQPFDQAQRSYHPDALAQPTLQKHSAGDAAPAEEHHSGVERDINDDSFLRYCNRVHPVLPFLPSRETLLADLTHVPPPVSQAFVDAFHLCMGISTSPTPDIGVVFREISDYEASKDKLTPTYCIVHIRTLILAALAADGAGPALENPFLTPANFINKAASFALSHSVRALALQAPDITSTAFLNPDGAQALWHKTFWSLVILDRFTAAGWGTPLAIPAGSAVLLQAHKKYLGESVYFLAELAEAIGQSLPFSKLPVDVWDTSHAAFMSGIRSTGPFLLDQWRRNIPENITPSSYGLVHLAYWHARALNCIASCAPPFNDTGKTREVFWAISGLVEQLDRSHQQASPLTHHFVVLAVTLLLELSRVPELRERVNSRLSEVAGTDFTACTWIDAARDMITNANESGALGGAGSSITQSTASQSLRHLADLATTGLSAAGVAPGDQVEAGVDECSASRDGQKNSCEPFTCIEGGYLATFASRVIASQACSAE